MSLYQTVIFFLLASGVYAQGVEELDKRNGFKDIKMVSLITDYEGLEYKKDIEDDVFPKAQLYVAKKGFYESIGTIKIYDLEVKVYRDSIFEVKVITEKEPNLYKGLKKAFGEPEYSYRSSQYFWKSDRLKLSYESYSSNKIQMVYRSFLMKDKLKEDKQKVVEDIVDDF